MERNLRVHISPVGHEPPNRVTIPLIEYRADRVYLLTNTIDTKEAAENLHSIQTDLKKALPSCNIHIVRTDMWNLFSCVEECRRIFRTEKENHVYVNVSTGSKILAIAGMLSCMLWGGQPYYTTVDYSTSQVKRVDNLPVYKINQPSPESLRVISAIKEKGGRISKKDLIAILQSPEYRLIRVFDTNESKTAPHSRLRAILDPLEKEWNFVEVRSRGRRSEIRLTQQGESALRIFGDVKGKGDEVK